MTGQNHSALPKHINDITLDDLAQRHSDAVEGIDDVTFEISPLQSSGGEGGGGPTFPRRIAEGAMVNLVIGLLVIVAGAWMIFKWPNIMPPTQAMPTIEPSVVIEDTKEVEVPPGPQVSRRAVDWPP